MYTLFCQYFNSCNRSHICRGAQIASVSRAAKSRRRPNATETRIGVQRREAEDPADLGSDH